MGSGSTGNPVSLNLYSYTTGDPVNRFDPTGRDDCDPTDITCIDDFEGWGGPLVMTQNCGPVQVSVFLPIPSYCWGVPVIGVATSPPPAPLQCFFAGASTPPGSFKNVVTPTRSGPAFADPITMTFNATGGSGAYGWDVGQTVDASWSINYASGPPSIGSYSGTDALLPGELMKGQSSAVFTDNPAVFRTSAQGSPVTSALLSATFTTTVTLTSGSQMVTCPTVTWTAIINWPSSVDRRRGGPTGTATVAGVAGLF